MTTGKQLKNYLNQYIDLFRRNKELDYDTYIKLMRALKEEKANSSILRKASRRLMKLAKLIGKSSKAQEHNISTLGELFTYIGSHSRDFLWRFLKRCDIWLSGGSTFGLNKEPARPAVALIGLSYLGERKAIEYARAILENSDMPDLFHQAAFRSLTLLEAREYFSIETAACLVKYAHSKKLERSKIYFILACLKCLPQKEEKMFVADLIEMHEWWNPTSYYIPDVSNWQMELAEIIRICAGALSEAVLERLSTLGLEQSYTILENVDESGEHRPPGGTATTTYQFFLVHEIAALELARRKETEQR